MGKGSDSVTVTGLAGFLQETDGSLRVLFVRSDGECVHKIQPLLCFFYHL